MMNFWILWVIGIVISFVIGCEFVRGLENPHQVWVYILVTFCIVMVGGSVDGKIFGMFYNVPLDFYGVCIIIVIMGATYAVGYAVLGLHNFEKPWLQVYFAVIFVISVISWTTIFANYNKNIEVITETIIEQREARQLIYFGHESLQEMAENVDGYSHFGNGSIATTYEISYMYVKENNRGDWGVAPVESSEMIFFNDDTIPYVEIISYKMQTTTINHNNGEESTIVDKEWKEYKFHLPESFKQYELE